MVFYDSLEAIRAETALLGYVSVLERAWDSPLNIDGVLCIDGHPVLYVKEYRRTVAVRERIACQRLFWNQGVANVLVILDPAHAYIYSGLARPLEDATTVNDEPALVETLERASYAARIKSIYHQLATGRYYQDEHARHFDPSQAVDAYLIENLGALRDLLTSGRSGLSMTQAHAFLGRILFVCYLIDRGIYAIGDGRRIAQGAAVLAGEIERRRTHAERLDYLYAIFRDLRDKFNGNMFDHDLDAERGRIRKKHLDDLASFLRGDGLKTRQRTLGFWAYDFRMIPVETISAIYEDFLGKEDTEAKRSRGAFYTPRFLAEMVVDVALADTPTPSCCRLLDPACGSGVFLVTLFNRLANRWIHANRGCHYETKARALQAIWRENLRGMDIEETSCRIACFSLYLAYLDCFDPPAIQEYMRRTGHRLPKLLDYGGVPSRPAADIPVIRRGDFLNTLQDWQGRFDVVIGNPPWEGRGRKQIAQRFMEAVPNVLRNAGTGCLLLPTKMLQNRTDTFQSEWLRQVTLNEVIQLADYSFLLFEHAMCPAFIARFSNETPDLSRHEIAFRAPKFNRDSLRRGLISVERADCSSIPLARVLAAAEAGMAPVEWKRHFWGTPRDKKFLDLLLAMPPLSELAVELSKCRTTQGADKCWSAGQGLKPRKRSAGTADRELKPIGWPLDTPFLDADSWGSDLFALEADTISFEERLRSKGYRTDVLYSRPPGALFASPMVLVSQGSRNMKVAFCDFPVLFQDSLQSIAGASADTDLLMFLAAYLRSGLAKYFLFHTSANWGSERDKVHLNELLRVPFPVPGCNFVPKAHGGIVARVASRIRSLKESLASELDELRELEGRVLVLTDENPFEEWRRRRAVRVETLQTKLDQLIYEYFGLTSQEIALIEDTVNIAIPSSTPHTWSDEKVRTLDRVDSPRVDTYREGLSVYAETLAGTMNRWAEEQGSSYRVSPEGGTDAATGLAVVTLRMTTERRPYLKKPVSADLWCVLDESRKQHGRGVGALSYPRDILLFLGECIHIVRPALLARWTRTAALNDAARLYGEIISENGA